MLKDNISEQLKTALKAHDEIRLSTMRMLLSALNYARIDKMSDLTPEEEISVVKKEAKKRNDAIEMYEKIGKTELVSSEKAELAILQEFLPKAISEEQIKTFIDEAISSGLNDFGGVMKEVMKKANGAADGKLVSSLVREKLQ